MRQRRGRTFACVAVVVGAVALAAGITAGAFAFSPSSLGLRGVASPAITTTTASVRLSRPIEAPDHRYPDLIGRASGRSHLQVTEVEYRLILSRGVVKAGPVDLATIDAGMDPHDLRLRHSGSGPELDAPELTSGKRWDGMVYLRPGVYRLWCSLPEHARLGMHATLHVVR